MKQLELFTRPIWEIDLIRDKHLTDGELMIKHNDYPGTDQSIMEACNRVIGTNYDVALNQRKD